jgi:STE24 endopeptidase
LNESKATRYQRLRRRAGAAEVVSGAVALGVLALPAVAGAVARWAAAAAGGSRIGSLVLFAVAVAGAWRAGMLPARLFAGRRVSERYGAPAAGAGMVLEEVQAAGLAVVMALLVAATVGLAMALAPGWWWVLAGCGLAGWLALAMRAMPLILAWLAPAGPPVRPGLERRLTGMALAAGVPVTSIGVLAGQGSPVACVTGAGRTRRVFLSQELVRDWSDDEIAVVVAHEIGHHARHDLMKGAALSAVTMMAALGAADAVLRRIGPALGLAGPADLGAWPLLLLVAAGVWLAATPLRHAQSRRHERLADEFALRLTGETEAFSTAIRRLGARHLAEERPSTLTRWLFHTHPSVGERLALASRFRGVVTR